jgi:hypothetical protein
MLDDGLFEDGRCRKIPIKYNSFGDSYNESHQDALFLSFIGKEICVFRTDLLSIIWSLNTVFTQIPIAVNTVLRFQMMDSKSVRNMQSSLPK